MSMTADLIVSVATVHTLVPGQPAVSALAVKGDRIVALAAHRADLDPLAGPDTVVIDRPGAVVLPAFDDTHTHLVLAASSAADVPVHLAGDIPEFVELIRERARQTPPGQWIRSTANWQEINLAERRFPTADELDAATVDHPVLVMRGGHNIVVNHRALELAGIDEHTPDPVGGKIGRADDGRLDGWLQDNACTPVLRLQPSPSVADRIEGFRCATTDYADHGIGVVRDCMVSLADLDVLRQASEQGALRVRVRALIATAMMTRADDVDALLDEMEQWRYRADPWLSVWGVKFLFDGGIEAAATREPYACDPSFFGHLTWDPAELLEAMDRVLRRGWRIGTHAYGDRSVETLLDLYAALLDRHPGLPPHMLVLEHGGFADDGLRSRAVELGIPVTIQHPLLHDTARIEDTYWGPERVDALFPARQWIDQGALVTAGSDYPVGHYGAMHSVWGMVTRQTVTGVRGAEHAITVDEAIRLHTVNAAALTGEAALRGSLTVGRLADLTVWDVDPTTATIDELRDLLPVHTVVGGRVVTG